MSENGTGQSPEAQLEELDAACRQFVWTKLQLELDGAQETLPILDHYVRLIREDLARAPHTLDVVAQSVGAYFGNVLTQVLEGFWRFGGSEPGSWLVCASPVHLALNPVAVSYEILEASAQHRGPSSELYLRASEREVVERRLAGLPQISEDEYFTFSSRVEGLEVALAALREQAHAAGREQRALELSDYEDP